jgi:hypothetical protein
MRRVHHVVARTAAGLLVVGALTSGVLAQCGSWIPGGGGISPPDIGGFIPGTFAFAPWDRDGAGPQSPKIVAGTTFGGSAGYPQDGLAIFDPDTGNWSALGTLNPSNSSVTTVTSTPGGALIVGGTFSAMSGTAANRLVRLDGNTWTEIGGGVSGGVSPQPRVVLPLSDTEFIVGGAFTTAGGGPSGVGGLTVNNIARWDGSAWSTLGSGFNGDVLALLRMPNGDIIAGGSFTQAGSVAVNRVARWNGTTWSALGGGSSGPVHTLGLLPDGTLVGPMNFSGSGGFARWNGTAWVPFGGGNLFGTIHEVVVGSNGELFVAGTFQQAQSSVASGITRWNGVQWSSLGTGMNGSVISLALIDNRLYLQGPFTTADGNSAFGFARYDFGSASVTITAQPTSLTRCSGAPASFSVTATGSGPFTYQWRRNGTNVNTTTNPSAATATLLISSTSGSTTGTYTCVVTSAGGCAAVVSNAATLTTVSGTPPTVSLDPDPVDTCEGLPAEFFVAASGTGPFTYQWRKDGVAIPAASNPSAVTSSLTIAAVTAADVGSYTCVISNACNSVTSAPAALTIGSCSLACSPADIANTDGDPIPDGSIDNGDFSLFFSCFFLPANDPLHLLADIANTDGDTVQTGGGPDGQVDNGDFTAFFSFFFQGCAAP